MLNQTGRRSSHGRSQAAVPRARAQPGDAPPGGPGRQVSRGAERQRLFALLAQAGVADAVKYDPDELLEGQSGPYSVLLRLLAHLDFDETSAMQHWQAICQHRDALAGWIGRDPGVPVAALDYFQNIRHMLCAPIFIERDDFDATERSAMIDALTGLFNRRYFQCSLEREVERAQRYGVRFSLAFFDVDDFKQINDHHGHPVGDEALIHVSTVIRQNLRQVDVPCRFGGEEFAVILPGTDRTGAFVLADRIRAEINRLFNRHRFCGRLLELTVSAGVATCPDDAWSADELARCSDRSLYRAKRKGKNRVVALP